MAEAILNGTIIDDGGLDCDARFQYGTTPALGTYTPWVASGLRTGDSFQALITGLLGNTNYYFRAECLNAVGGGTAGSTLSFITTKPALPSVAALMPDMITESAARLRGYLTNDAGKGGDVCFEWGATIAYGMKTPWLPGYATGDTFYQTIYGLSPGGAYHCRAVFRRNPVVYSGDVSFSTLSSLGAITLVDDELLHLLKGGL